MTYHHYAELRSETTGGLLATLWNHQQFPRLLNNGYGPSWAHGRGITDPAADAVVTAAGRATAGSPYADGAWWTAAPGAENSAGLLVSRVTGIESSASSRAVLSSVNSDAAIIDRRGTSPRVFTVAGTLYGIDRAAVSNMRQELVRLLDPYTHSEDLATDDIQLWWPELCEADPVSCPTHIGNCTGTHWRYLRSVVLVDAVDVGDRSRDTSPDGAAVEVTMRLVAADPRVYVDDPAAITLTPSSGASVSPDADPAHTTVSTTISLPKTALPIRLNPDKTWCEIGWDTATRNVSQTYLEVRDVKEVYTPEVSVYDDERVEPYGILVRFHQYRWDNGNPAGKSWTKLNPSRWPADGSFPTDAPIEIQAMEVWEPGYAPEPDEVSPYGVHLFFEPNLFDNTRIRFSWEPINPGRWPRRTGTFWPMPDDAPVEVQVVTYPNVEYDDSEPENPIDNPKWITERAPSGGEPFEVRLLRRETVGAGGFGAAYGDARPVNWALPVWNDIISEATHDISYVWQNGDTLSSIASDFGVTNQELIDANPWTDNLSGQEAGVEIVIPDQLVDDPDAQIQFPPLGGRFIVKHTRGMYQGGDYEPVERPWQGGFVEVSSQGTEPFDIVLTRNGRWVEANGSWDVADDGLPPRGGRIRLLPDWNPYSPATDPAAVDAYECPTLDPILPISVDSGSKTWVEAGTWAFDGEWPADSTFDITAETPGTYSVSVDVHDPNCPACGSPGCDIAAIFGDSVYVADIPKALTDVPSGVTIGTPPSSVRQTVQLVGPTDRADPFDMTITVDPGASTLANWRLLMWPNPDEDPIGSLDRCDAYRFRFASLPAGVTLRLDTRTGKAILDCGDGIDRDASALVAGEHGGRPRWPDRMAGRWTVAVEADPANTHASASVSIAERHALPAV